MKKIIKTFVVTLICVFSIANVFAYASSSNVYANGGTKIASKSAWIGDSKNASARAINDSRSDNRMIMQIWGSWKGAIYPNTVEAQTTLYAGNSTVLQDAQTNNSVFMLALSPGSANTTGRGRIVLGSTAPSLP